MATPKPSRTPVPAATLTMLQATDLGVHAIWEAASDAMALSDPDGIVLAANPAYFTLYGYRPEEVVGQSFAIIFPEDVRAWAVDEYRRMFAGPEIAPAVESVIRTKDGTERTVESRYTFLTRVGQRTAMLSVVRDITARKQAEEEREALLARAQQARHDAEAVSRKLDEAYALLDTLFAQAPVGLGFWDRELRFVRLNQALAGMNGLPVEVHLGKTPDQLLPGLEGLEQILTTWRRILATGEPVLGVEISGETPAAPGQLRHWQENWFPVRVQDEVIGIGAVVEEVTARKQAEAEREALLAREQAARQDAEQALRLRDQVLATVSHDLKNPLATIKGLTQLVVRMAGRDHIDPAQVVSFLTDVDRATTTMHAMLDELLETARLQMGAPLTLLRQPTSLAALVARIVALQQQRTTAHQIRVVTGEGDLAGDWDPARLERVVENLIGNAVKYSPAGGEVTVTLDHEQREGADWAVLTVADQGLGIPAADLPHIFAPFHRASNVEAIAGTGIGLAGVKHIVEAHGGSVKVASTEDVGTIVTVRLPHRPPPRLEH